MKAPEITNELKNDLKVLKMRASLDPKHFYKKNDRDGLPKYFQVRKQQRVALYCWSFELVSYPVYFVGNLSVDLLS